MDWKQSGGGRLTDFAGLVFYIRFPPAFIAVHVKARGIASCSLGPPVPIQCRFVRRAMIGPCDQDVRIQNPVLDAPSIPVRAGVSENPRPGCRWIPLWATVLPLDCANVVWGQRVIMFVRIHDSAGLQLLEIARTSHGLRRHPCFGECREEHAGENDHDRNHNQ